MFNPRAAKKSTEEPEYSESAPSIRCARYWGICYLQAKGFTRNVTYKFLFFFSCFINFIRVIEKKM